MTSPNISRTYLTVNDALPDLARHVLDGDELGSRKGERVLERLHQQVTLTEPWDRYNRLPLRKASLPAQIAETMWVLAGRNDIEWLSYYLPRAAEFSDNGATWRGGYGPRLRRFAGIGADIDQISYVVEELRVRPTSRRAVMSIWDPAVDVAAEGESFKDVPCNDFISFQSRLGELHMHVFVRSNDLMWGWSGINAFEWSVLQEVIAGMLGIEVGNLTFSISSLHAYDRHWSRLRQISEAYPDPVAYLDPHGEFDAPRLTQDPLRPKTVAELDAEIAEWFRAEARIREAKTFDEAWAEANSAACSSLFDSFLQVIAAARFNEVGEVPSRTLRAALTASPVPPFVVKPNWTVVENTSGRPETVLPPAESAALAKTETFDEFIESIIELHNTKHLAYGNSWKRRGETLGILANIARKVDRLGSTDQYETAMDTAVDLLVYLAKYQVWLEDQDAGEQESDRTIAPNGIVRGALRRAQRDVDECLIDPTRLANDETLSNVVNATVLADGWITSRLYRERANRVNDIVRLAAQYVVRLRREKGGATA